MSNTYHVAVVGASGVVGRKIVQVLEERDFPVGELSLFSSARSAGQTIPFKGEEITIQELTEDSLKAPIQIAIFSAGGETSKQYAPIAAANGVTVIDNSSAWRMDADKPLVVPEVNPDTLHKEDKIIANPNCSTIQSVVPLKPLHDNYGINRVVYNTYQAVSGAGRAGIEDLENHTTNNFPYAINETVIPQIDVFLEDGYTKEEQKMIDETRKILGEPDLRVTATAVRVPIKTSHGVSINIELAKEFDLDQIREEIGAIPGVIIADDPDNLRYPLQSEAADTDNVYVGRIRRDPSVENGLNLFVVADNLRKGAATNSVQIAETLVERNLV
ncbi:aspartate-semialdehyde dehydrogenase [Suicoccus acidiformans]|uniref:Aspartate-semialdehyde dehydrogenase n=1 Tax=Suicoccus acidiformans TaxID=2036206 RepID=A0A347WKQ5_9LACT|nr:aspartate-semialdehyde dehydrogenase [Suicoccus acidiformans]AXY25662.1 aspartate-semialdehyde dehydrogenase [Suicoccus acidiformans]